MIRLADVPTPDQVRAALERIVVSNVFSSSPQLASFLSFVVEAVLHGKSDRIKGYTIGVEVLRRDVKFDPQLDPIVRVEATRLRRALERYYAGPGLTDTVIIGLPRGSYVPTFGYRHEILDNPEESQAPAGLVARRNVWLAAVGALIVIVFARGLYWATHRSPSGRSASLSTGVEALPPGNGMPTLMVERLSRSPARPTRARCRLRRCMGKLRETFSRFDAINISSQDAAMAVRRLITACAVSSTISTMARPVFASVCSMSGTAMSFGPAIFRRLAAARDRAALEELIVADIATSLLQPFRRDPLARTRQISRQRRWRSALSLSAADFRRLPLV